MCANAKEQTSEEKKLLAATQGENINKDITKFYKVDLIKKKLNKHWKLYVALSVICWRVTMGLENMFSH